MERTAKERTAQSTEGMVESWQNAVPLAEVREMLIELANMPMWDDLDKAIDFILRKRGYGGES